MLLCCSAGTSAAAESARRRQRRVRTTLRSRWIPGLGTCLDVYFLVHSVCHHNHVPCLFQRDRPRQQGPPRGGGHGAQGSVPDSRLRQAANLYGRSFLRCQCDNDLHSDYPGNPDETRTCIQQGAVSKTVADYRKELALQLIGNTVDHVAVATRSMSADAAADAEPRAPSNFMPAQPHEHVVTKMPDNKKLSCSMCRARAKSSGIKSTDPGGFTQTYFCCKICYVVMHNDRDCKDLHVRMVAMSHPDLHQYTKFVPGQKSKRGGSHGGGRPQNAA